MPHACSVLGSATYRCRYPLPPWAQRAWLLVEWRFRAHVMRTSAVSTRFVKANSASMNMQYRGLKYWHSYSCLHIPRPRSTCQTPVCRSATSPTPDLDLAGPCRGLGACPQFVILGASPFLETPKHGHGRLRSVR